jgi:hypothetical protein
LKAPAIYGFEQRDFQRVGKLLADRDSFVVFFYLAKSSQPPHLKDLAGLFRRDLSILNDIFQQLASLGLVQRRGGVYISTRFGQRVMSFLEDVTEGVELPVATVQTSSPAVVTSFSSGVGLAATNNGVYSTFSTASHSPASSLNSDFHKVKLGELTTEGEAETFSEGDSLPKDAARPHNYL